MNLSSLTPSKGSVQSTKRIARGQGSGRGGTSTRGHKGAKSRSGYSKKVGFEGGQMPLQRRVPKFGFTNINRKEYKGLNLSLIEALVEKLNVEIITFATLVENGLVSKKGLVKILGDGELTKKISIEAHGFSGSAKAAIEKNGGEAKTI